MHYYQFSIGDYRAATAHLSNEEDLAYRRLLDMYYDTEQKIPLDTQWVARRLRVEAVVVRDVLNDMFVKHEDGWFHARCDDVIQQYHAMAEKNRANGKLGGRKKNPVGSDSQPIAKATNNHKPITKNQDKVAAAPVVLPDWIPLDTWEAYLAMRKKIKKPATEYAIKLLIDKLTKFKGNGQDIKAVLEKSITSGWQDVFEIHEKQFGNKFDVAHATTPPPPNQDAALKKIAEDRKKAVPMPADIKAKMAELTKGMKV